MKMRSLPKWLWWLAIPIGLILVVVLAASILDEPLRPYAEAH